MNRKDREWIVIDFSDLKTLPNDFFVNGKDYVLEYWEDDRRELEEFNDPEAYDNPSNYNLDGDWVKCDENLNVRPEMVDSFVGDNNYNKNLRWSKR